jgi:hypothetical protein
MPPSVFTWLDYSEEHRRRVLDVLSAFAESETVDELGLSHIRDGIADILFPGTSTIQRGARYFLFVPWICLDLERKKIASSDIAGRARQLETGLIAALLKAGETTGVIGSRAGSRLKRLPSSIYWNGLEQWGIRTYSGSQDQYHRSLDSFYRRNSELAATKDDDGQYVDSNPASNWHRGIPPAPKGFPSQATLRLTPDESRYLEERILSSQPASMLARLVVRQDPLTDSEFPWQLERLADLPDVIQELLHHARNCSELLHGASLLYNLMLSEKQNTADLIDHYRQDITQWRDQIEAGSDRLKTWDRNRLWTILQQRGFPVPRPTKEFVGRWASLVFSAKSFERMADDQGARQLVTFREMQLKDPII